MEISVFSIQKSNADSFDTEISKYIKMSEKFASINDKVVFSKRIAQAQKNGCEEALKAYDEVYFPHLNGYCVALDERGEQLDSLEFSKILSQSAHINFFIGGAYGLSENFKSKAQKIVSLTRLTLAHKVAKLMLFEQIFRALCINANHPYHK